MASDVKLNINSINFYFTHHLWFPKPLVNLKFKGAHLLELV